MYSFFLLFYRSNLSRCLYDTLGFQLLFVPNIMIPDCFALRAPTILKTFIIRSFFYEKWLLIHVFGGSQGQKSSCKQACIGFLTF